MVFGGFGFTPRQLARHENLYRERGFAVEPVLSTIPELITPKVAWRRGPALAALPETQHARPDLAGPG